MSLVQNAVDGLLGLLLLAVALALSLVAIRPRLWNKTNVGFIFWGSITGHGTALQFTQEVRGLSARDRTVAIADHLFVLAAIAKRKYAYIDRALYAGLAGGALGGVALFIHHAWR